MSAADTSEFEMVLAARAAEVETTLDRLLTGRAGSGEIVRPPRPITMAAFSSLGRAETIAAPHRRRFRATTAPREARPLGRISFAASAGVPDNLLADDRICDQFPGQP